MSSLAAWVRMWAWSTVPHTSNEWAWSAVTRMRVSSYSPCFYGTYDVSQTGLSRSAFTFSHWIVFWIVTSSSMSSAQARGKSKVCNCEMDESLSHLLTKSAYLFVDRSRFGHHKEPMLTPSLFQHFQGGQSHVGQTGLIGSQGILTTEIRMGLVTDCVVHVQVSFKPTVQKKEWAKDHILVYGTYTSRFPFRKIPINFSSFFLFFSSSFLSCTRW